MKIPPLPTLKKIQASSVQNTPLTLAQIASLSPSELENSHEYNNYRAQRAQRYESTKYTGPRTNLFTQSYKDALLKSGSSTNDAQDTLDYATQQNYVSPHEDTIFEIFFEAFNSLGLKKQFPQSIDYCLTCALNEDQLEDILVFIAEKFNIDTIPDDEFKTIRCILEWVDKTVPPPMTYRNKCGL